MKRINKIGLAAIAVLIALMVWIILAVKQGSAQSGYPIYGLSTPWNPAVIYMRAVSAALISAAIYLARELWRYMRSAEEVSSVVRSSL